MQPYAVCHSAGQTGSKLVTRHVKENFLPGVEDKNCVKQRLDWTPEDAESATFERMRDKADVEKSAFIFVLLTTPQDRQVTLWEVSMVSIVVNSNGNNNNEGEAKVRKRVWICTA